ncbi:bifunctional 2-polyprenyl-6-hydroxyphenol methylase/3-demethylubiquinol 3-O-methyltransferase UbiG [Telmatospirillum sp. J64-1]|uniref:class I SAM-dependent methyltransferase n=1 Tax=Telmatospirillum sp. J64-1 TaxID=2502183 RepID=UPI00115F3CE1|nr:class I SAM-dependent methyltransferase [Telmatospirillum sp. J64-1]
MIEEYRPAYGSLAALIYNLDKPVGRSFGDIEFYRNRLKAAGARNVLEPAAGNGRALIPLAKAGFTMTGFDNSAHMLGFLKRNCADHGVSPDIKDASFDDFEFDRRFDALVLPAGSFQLL